LGSNNYHLQKKKEYDARKRKFINFYKMEQGCELCGYNEHPAALTFDHIDPSTKIFNVSDYGQRSWEAIIKEIAKCRVLCANCHNIHSSNNYDNGIVATPVSAKVRELMGDILGMDYIH